MEILVAILTIIIFFQPTMLILAMPMMHFYASFQKKGGKINHVLALPLRIVNKITNHGYCRWVIWKVGLIPSHTIRNRCYRMMGAEIAKKAIIYFRAELRAPQKLKIGKGSIIGDNAILDARSGLTIGENVNLSSNVSIYTLQHNHRSPDFDCKFDRDLSVRIENRVWLGSNVIVLPGVTIGEGAVVCAGAVVAHDVPPYAVVAGIPAKQVGERPRNLTYEFPGKPCWFY